MGGLTDGTKIGTGEKIVIFLETMRGNTHRDGLSLWCLTPFRGVRYHLFWGKYFAPKFKRII